MSGMLLGSSGFDPRATLSPSGYPSPSVSGLKGSVPSRRSSSSVKPSPSLSIEPLDVAPGTGAAGPLDRLTCKLCRIDPETVTPRAVFCTENKTLSASKGFAPEIVFSSENKTLSASWGVEIGATVFRIENVTLSASWGSAAEATLFRTENTRLSASCGCEVVATPFMSENGMLSAS